MKGGGGEWGGFGWEYPERLRGSARVLTRPALLDISDNDRL
jgi:hypothetical protein